MHYSLPRAASWNLAGYLYLILASLISTPILIHSLGFAQFGQYSLVLAAIILVSSLDLGLPQAVVRLLSLGHKTSVARQTIWATSSVLFIVSGAVSGIIATLIVSRLHLGPWIGLLTFSLCLIHNLVAHYQTLPQAEGHFGYFNAKTFIVGSANTLLASYLAWSGYDLVVIFASQLGAYFLTLLVLAYFSLKFFPRPRDGVFSKKIAISLLSFGIKNQLGKFVGQVQSQYAKYLLAGISPLSLSSYIVSVGLVQKLAGGVAQMATALYPASSRSENNQFITQLYHRLQLGLLALALLGIWLYHQFGYAFLSLWLGSPQLVVVVDSVMQILVWYFAFLILTPLASTILDSHGRPGLTSLFALLTTAIEITLALLLFGRFGLFAPIYSSLIAIIITTPILLLTTERVLKSKL